MTTRQIQTIIFILVLAAGMGLVFLLLPGQTQAQGGGVGAQAAVGTAFTYQGQLMYNGSAISGTCDLTFNLYNVDSGSTPVDSVNKPSVPVSDGYFSVDLDFGTSAFTGEARWLEIKINSCPGGASNATLSPRVALNPAPYALSLRPGAVINGSVGGSLSDSVLKAINSATSGATYGVYGQTNSSGSNASGVYGYAGAGTGFTKGVFGWSASDGGTGVYGYTDAASGTTYGVYGKSESSSGYGVYGTAPTTGTVGIATATSGVTYGVYGQTDSNSPTASGVYGTASSTTGKVFGVAGEIDTTDSSAAGVYGVSNSGSAAGVKGLTTSSSQFASGVYGTTGSSGEVFGVWGDTDSSSNGAAGVYGSAGAFSGTTYGVYGRSNSPSGYGIYSNGNAHVEGQLTWKPITSYLSIPAAAFVPQYNYTAQTYNAGSIVRTLSGSENTFNAPVQLPHGSTVISMTVYWRDDYAGGDGTITLRRSTFSLFPSDMAQVTTSGSGGDGNGTDSTISNGQVDNSQYTYYLTAQLPTDGTNYVGLYGVVIAYTIDRPY